MKLIDRLERRFGSYAIADLPLCIAIMYIAGYLISLVSPGFYDSYLALDVGMLLKGQIWRIITFIIQPPSTGLFYVILAVYLYYMISKILNQYWGAFRFNLYFFSGILFHVLGAIIAYLLTWVFFGEGISFHLGINYLNLSMFFAFAAMFPDMQMLLFFVIPIKMKWLAIIDAVFFGYSIVRGFLPTFITGYSTATRLYLMSNSIAALVSLLNFFIFFISMKKRNTVSFAQAKNRRRFQQAVRRESSTVGGGTEGIVRHRCCICGRTNLTDPNLEFRFCSKCAGGRESCPDHLFTHEHVK